MGSKTYIHVAPPPTQKPNPTFLNTFRGKLGSLGSLFHNLHRSPSNYKLEPKPEPESYPDPRNIVRPSRPINPPDYDSLSFTGPTYLPPSIGSAGIYPENGNDASRSSVAVRKRDSTGERHKADKGRVTGDRRPRGVDAIGTEKRHSTGERHKTRVENKNEGHGAPKSNPPLTQINEDNEGYNIRGSSAVLRGIGIMDKTSNTDRREKIYRRRSTNSSNSTGEITALTRSSGDNAEKGRRTKNALTKNERPNTLDNAFFTANRGNKTEEMEKSSKRSKTERRSITNGSNPPEGTVPVNVERHRKGEVNNAGRGHNTSNSASVAMRGGSGTDKVDETGSRDKTSKKSKIHKKKTKKKDKTAEGDVSTGTKRHEERKAASTNERRRSSNALVVTRKGRGMEEGYETSWSNAAVAGGSSRPGKTLESTPGAGNSKHDRHERRKSRRISRTHEGNSDIESTVTITTNNATGRTAPESTIRIKSRNGGRLLLLLPNSSVVVIGGGQ